MLQRLKAALVLISALLHVVSAQAHDADFALTSITWNADTRALEIIHRLHTHHAFDGAALILRQSKLAGTGPKEMAALGLYIERHFTVADGDGQALTPVFVGAELEGDDALVYQEVALPAAPTQLTIVNTILTALRPGQINHVTVAMPGIKKTLVFNADTQTLQAP